MAVEPFLPGDSTIYVGAASASTGACTAVTTYVTNWSRSGGDKSVDAVYLFGGATLQVKKPRTNFEVSLDVVMKDTSVLLFDQMMMGSVVDGSTAVDSTQDSFGKVVYIQSKSTNGSYYTVALNNAIGKFEPESAADEYVKGTLTFTCTATTAAGSANIKSAQAMASTLTW